MDNQTCQTSISDLQRGECGFLTELLIGRQELSRCTSLGLTPGAEITIVQNYGRGPMILKVRGTQVAIGRGQANKLYVCRSQA